MAKVFISFLGTTDYSKVTYVYDTGRKLIKTQTRFVQMALVNSICKNWGKDDRIVIFRTEKSNELNWKDHENRVGLMSELLSFLSIKDISGILNIGEEQDDKKYIVPTGFNEEDLWKIFGKVYENVKEGDEIYFDVTHAFRTIPLFTTVLFNYCRFMKNSVVKSIHYGAYESLLTLKELNKMTDEEKEKLEVPLVDLTNVVLLQSVNDSVSNFRQFGSFGSLVNVLDTDRERQGALVNDAICGIQNALEKLNFYIMTSNLVKLQEGEYMETIEDMIDQLTESTIPTPQKELLKEIVEEMRNAGFVDEYSYKNIEAAIEWSANKNQLQQAVTLASEYIKETYYAIYQDENYEIRSKKNENINEIENNNKSCISYILNAEKYLSSNNENPYKFVSKKWEEVVSQKGFNQKEVLAFINLECVISIQKPYSELRALRNQLNHAGEISIQTTLNNNKRSNLENKKMIDKMTDLKKYFFEIWKKCKKSLEQIEQI